MPGDSGPVPPLIVTQDKAGRPGTLRVTVRDARTDAAIADAVASFEPSGRGTATDDRGEARLDSVPNGTRVLTMRRVGYQTRVDTLGVAPNAAEHVVARLQHAGFCVEKVVQARQATPATKRTLKLPREL